MNRSLTQKTLVQSQSSILFNNSITHDSLISIQSQNRDKTFEYPPNPTISQSNHSELLKDSQVMLKLSQKKKQELSNLHQSIKDPNINIFKLKEGEYDNMTYQGKMQNKQVFIPRNQASEGRNNYKFQMSKQEYFDTIQNLPRANINPFHLVPDLNPQQQDLVSQQVPIYQKLSLKNQNRILDESIAVKENQKLEKKSAKSSSKNVETNTSKNEIVPYNSYALDQSEFDLFFKQQEQQQKMLIDQQIAIQEYGRNHPPNFQGKSELAQLAKCMILNQNNSPFCYQVSNTISLGRTADDLLTISKYNDKEYYHRIRSQDKNINIPQHIQNKLKSEPSFQQGSLVFGRIAKNIVQQHNPSLKQKYTQKEEEIQRKNNGYKKNLSLKRQNLYRNLGSYNILTHQLRIINEDYLQNLDKSSQKKEITSNRTEKSASFFQPAFLTQQQQQQQQQQINQQPEQQYLKKESNNQPFKMGFPLIGGCLC
ncbi:hypothetical protein ABPG72_006167 [Tetrahymena utriculariae]